MNGEISARDLLLLCSTEKEQQLWIEKIKKHIPKKKPPTNHLSHLQQYSSNNSQSHYNHSSNNNLSHIHQNPPPPPPISTQPQNLRHQQQLNQDLTR